MRTIVFYICLLTACFICGAKKIIIMPQLAESDTIMYRTTAQTIMYHENDSLVSQTKLLPEIIVEGKNNKGFVIKTTNRLEDFSIECSDPSSDGQLPDKTETLNDFVAAVVMRIQLDVDCRPDSILNMAEVRETLLNAYIRMFTKEQGMDITRDAEWETETKPLMIGAIDMTYTPKHLIETQFGYIPYFNFIGVPLKSGKIPASMALPDELQKMCPELKELKMKVSKFENNMESGIEEKDGLYHIKLSGKKGTVEIDGELLYAAGILTNGFLSLRNESDTEKLISNYVIEIIR